MIVSLNEVESLSLKAARGAGMSWGLAEEAAHAARWLAARGWAWDRSLVGLLERREQIAAPMLAGHDISSSRQGLAICPIHAGAAMADLLHVHESVTLYDVLSPIWLVPFAHRRTGEHRSVEVTWSGGACSISAGGAISAEALGTQDAPLGWIRVELKTDVSSPDAVPMPTRPVIPAGTQADPAAWAALEQWAARTYVPASLQSRLAGAGAGLSDND
jgi:hypothetical protein